MIIRPCRRPFPLFLLAVLLLLTPGLAGGGSAGADPAGTSVSGAAKAPPAPAAQRSDPFTVQDVHVDATGSTTTSAREAARIDGQRRALNTLWERLVSAEDRARLPKLSDAQITDLVHDFEVANERSSAVRYLGDYTFRFRKTEIRKILKSADIAFAESVSKPVVVVPVLRVGANTALWDGADASAPANSWKQAWSEAASARGAGGLVPVLVPPGDPGDSAAINADQALSGDPLALGAFAGRYGTTEVLVALATLANKDAPQIDTSLSRYSEGRPLRRVDGSYRLAAGEGMPQLIARAVSGSLAALEDAWKQDNQLRLGQEAALTVTVPIASLADWVALRNKLSGVILIRRSTLLSLTKGEALVELRYLGDIDRLRSALAQGGFTLSDGTPTPVLTPRSAVPGAGVPAAANPGTP